MYRLAPDLAEGDRIPAQRRRAPLVPLYTRRQRHRLLAAAAGVLVVVLAVVAGYVLTRPPPVVVVGENAVGLIGPGNAPRVSAAVRVGQRPTAIASGFGAVWVTNSADNSVSRINARSHDAAPIAVGASPAGVAVGAGAVWVANSESATVSRIDPTTSRTTVIPVRSGPTGIVFAFGSVWVTNALNASVTRIDPGTNKVAHVVPVGSSPTGIAVGAGYLWVTNQGDGTVTRFNPKTYVVDSPAVKVGSGPVGIAFGDGAAWVANNLDGTLSRIDANNLSVTSRTLANGGGAFGVAANGGDVWVSNENAGTLMRITARTFRLGATVPLRGAPLGLGFVGQDLWFTNAGGGSAPHRGGVLKIVGTVIECCDPAPVNDFTLHYLPGFGRLAAITNDGLVGLRRAGGVQGAGVVPDLATSLPTPTDNGRTYTFHLRTGLRYSTGAPVLAGDIRRGIERTVLHPDSAPADNYAAEIVGGQACETAANKAIAAKKPRPDCHLSRGITTDDRTGTITFHLTQPTTEFIYQLALPNASAVPEDTPIDLAPGTFLPATGPYMIRSNTTVQDVNPSPGRLELVRNPYFRAWSPAAQPAGYPDRIVLETGYTTPQAETQVAEGRADLVWNGVSGADGERLGTQYGSQLHTNPGLFTDYFFLNANRPPFNNREARRALAYALDRQALATADGGGSVTCQLIPPDFVGYQPYCPFTVGGAADGKWSGQDIATAQNLVRHSGTHRAKVVVEVYDNTGPRAVGQSIRDTLTKLGYQASLHAVKANYPPPANGNWDAAIGSWGADYPAPSQYLVPIGSCNTRVGFFNFNLSHYCDKNLDARMTAALAQQGTDPVGAIAAWTRLDRNMVDAAVVIPFDNNVEQDFVSRRVGNIPVHPITGPLISQMWVQ